MEKILIVGKIKIKKGHFQVFVSKIENKIEALTINKLEKLDI